MGKLAYPLMKDLQLLSQLVLFQYTTNVQDQQGTSHSRMKLPPFLAASFRRSCTILFRMSESVSEFCLTPNEQVLRYSYIMAR